MNRITLASLALLLLGGCSSVPTPTPTPTGPATFEVRGSLTLSRVMLYGEEGNECSGIDGYNDMSGGTQVKVSDSAGKVIGLGELEPGVARQTNEGQQGTNVCVFDFTVSDVPEGDGIFGVEVSHRGVIQFTRADADEVLLTLG